MMNQQQMREKRHLTRKIEQGNMRMLEVVDSVDSVYRTHITIVLGSADSEITSNFCTL